MRNTLGMPSVRKPTQPTHFHILTTLNRVVEASDGLQDELAETLRMVCTPEGVGNNLLELEHELEALTAQQNALLCPSMIL